jgi:hypothetical protein
LPFLLALGPAFTFSVSPAGLTYFQGVGAGAPPFFHGVGAGAPPFFHGVGAGAPPFAIITAPFPRAVTAVFKLIAPAKTNMARKTVVSLRDIVPSEVKETPVALYRLVHQCQVSQAVSLFLIDTHLPIPSFR